MKKWKPLKKTLNRFVRRFDPEMRVVKDKDFCYCFESKQIGVPTKPDRMEKRAVDYLKNKYMPKVKLNAFVWSFLHEIGHNQTEAESLDSPEYDPTLRVLAEMGETTEQNEGIYYNLVEERLATEWAVEWAEQHPKQAKRLEKRIAKAQKKV